MERTYVPVGAGVDGLGSGDPWVALLGKEEKQVTLFHLQLDNQAGMGE